MLARAGMHPPAVAVTRLLYGTGIGLLLGAGLGLQSGRSLTAQPPILAAVLFISALLLLLGWLLSKGKGPLVGLYSNESDATMARRVKEEIDEIQRSEDVTAKWAQLEAKVLTSDLGEEE